MQDASLTSPCVALTMACPGACFYISRLFHFAFCTWRVEGLYACSTTLEICAMMMNINMQFEHLSIHLSSS